MYQNPSSVSEHSTCKLCRLARTRNWINEKHNDTLSHKYGLSNNHLYYAYNPYTKLVEQSAITFQQLFGKSPKSAHEERVLAIPYNHIGTMGHHPDCDINSKIFPPNGNYYNEKYNCGALIYTNNKQSEVIFNLMNTYNSALTYAYKKYNKKFRIADLNYEREDGKYYKFYDPVKGNNNDPKLYIFFHGKANSEPHLHMHTYIDSQGNNLYDTLENTRYLINGHKIKYNTIDDVNDDTVNDDNVNDDNNNNNDNDNNYNNDYDYYSQYNSLMIGGTITDEIFGSSDFETYDNPKEYKNTQIRHIRSSGNRKANQQTPPAKIDWLKKTPWKDMFGIRSDSIDEKYRYGISCSFEYLFKKMIGIKNNDPRMKHKYIFPEPEYELQEKIFDQVEELKYNKIYEEIIKDIYNLTKIPLLDKNNYSDKSNKNNYGIKDKYQNSQIEQNPIKIKYGYSNDEQHICRQSDTDTDTLMLLLLQIACMNDPEIGGYYGHSAPILNKWNNITHTEICLFNLVDYPLKPMINAPYSTCNINNSENLDNNIKYLVFSMYLQYFTESQMSYILIEDQHIFIENDLIKQFVYKNTNMSGGRNVVDTLPEINIFPLNTNKNNINNKPNLEISNKNNINNKPNLEISNKSNIINKSSVYTYDEFTKFIVSQYNSKTTKYKIDENDTLVKNIVISIMAGCIPTAGQMSSIVGTDEKIYAKTC